MSGMMDFMMIALMGGGALFLYINRDHLQEWFGGGGGGCTCPNGQFCRIRDNSCYTPPVCTGGKVDDGNGTCVAGTTGGGNGTNVNCNDGHNCSTRCANGWCNSFKGCCKGQSCAHCGVTGGTSGSNCSSLNCDTNNGFAKVKQSDGKCKCLCQRASCGTSGSKCNKGWAYNQTNNSCICNRTSAGCSSTKVVTCLNSSGKPVAPCTSTSTCGCVSCPPGYHVIGNGCYKNATSSSPCGTGCAACNGLLGVTCTACRTSHNCSKITAPTSAYYPVDYDPAYDFIMGQFGAYGVRIDSRRGRYPQAMRMRGR